MSRGDKLKEQYLNFTSLCAFKPQKMNILEVSDVFCEDAREKFMMAMSRAGMAKALEDSNEHEAI